MPLLLCSLWAHGASLYEKEITLPPAENGKLITKSMDVVKLEYGVKYLLSFQAKIDGPDKLDVLSENLRLPSLYFQTKHGNYNGRPLPNWRVKFLDSAGKAQAFGMRVFNDVVWDEWEHCSEVFYLPYGTESFQLVLENPNSENTLLFRDFKLEKIDEDAININPDFRYGEFGYTGYTGDPRKDQIGIGRIRLKRQEDGKYAMTFIKGGTRSSNFPVKTNHEYRLVAEGTPPPGDLKINLVDTNNVIIKLIRAQLTYDFVVPADAVEAFLTIGGDEAIVKRIRVTEKKKSE